MSANRKSDTGNLQADVVVISAGTAGLAAAVTAAENGASVIAFEKAATVGGSGNLARGPLAIESKLQRLRKIAITREEAFKIHMDYTHWRVDARLVKAYYDKSASTIDWLEKMGVEFIDVQNHNYGFNFTWHIIKGPLVPREIPGTGVVMMKILGNMARELGVKILLRTPVKKILKEGGRIAGVIAEDENGEEIRAKAKAVIVATGGFGDNPEMVKKYTGRDIQRGRSRGLTGDGILMAWEAGAASTEMIMHGVPGTGGVQKLIHVSFTLSQPCLVVNLSGERFMNEEILQTTPFGGNAIARQRNGCSFIIFDEDTKNYYMEEGLDFPPGILVADPGSAYKIYNFDAEFQQALDQGVEGIFMADSLEELAGKTGIRLDTLLETVAEYNKACATGRDELFHKNPRYLRPVKHPKFYAAKLSTHGTFGSLGGIKINYKTEVLDKDFEVIPGLYAAGSDANSIYGDTYIFILPGNTLGFALNSGRIAGENAAEYVKSIVK
jgi:fumarate reductase flavoprotein subunit